MERRYASVVVVSGVAIVCAVVLANGWVTVEAKTTIGDLLVGVGTFALAAFTYRLGREARSEGRQIATQVALERERMESDAQPWVVPAPNPAWSWKEGEGRYADGVWMRLFPVKNIGPGSALNVRGSLKWGSPSGVHVDMLPTSVGPREREDLRVHWDAPTHQEWQRVQGTLDYGDSVGRRWRTTFEILTLNEGRYVEVANVMQTPGSTRPVANAPEGADSWPASELD
jgi:hypothetical protein